MSLKLQVATALATAGVAASIVTPLSLVSNNADYELPFSKVTIEKIVEDAGKVYSEKGTTEKLRDIFSPQKIEQFESLIHKIKSEEEEQLETTSATLSRDDREMLSSFYAVYSLLDKRKISISEELSTKENYGTWIENVKAEIVLSALEDIDWDSEALSFSEISAGGEDKNSFFNYFYETIPELREKMKRLKEGATEELKREVISNISKWLVKEMAAIHKNYFAIK